MKVIIRLTLVTLLTASLFACKKKVSTQTRFIPRNAAFVASINVGSIKDKLMKDQLTLENMFKYMTNTNDTAFDKGKKEWEDFKNSGIELDDNFFVWAVQKGGGSLNTMSTGKSVISVIGKVNNTGKLEAYIAKKDPSLKIEKDKDYSYTTKDGDKMIAWGKDVVIMMSYQQPTNGQMVYDSLTNSYDMQAPAQANMISELKTEMTASFNQKESSSIADIPEFRDLLQEKTDAGFWVNSATSFDDMPLPLPKLKTLLENNYTAATLNFEEGKIAMNSKSYSGKALKDIFKKYAGPEVDLNLVERYPSNNINGFMAFSFDPQLFYGIVQYMEVGGVVNGFLTRFMGSEYTLQDALKAIKGEIAVVVSDISAPSAATQQPGMPPNTIPAAKVIINIPVGDKVQMNKMMDKLVTMGMLTKQNNEYVPQGAMAPGVTAVANDKNILIASDQALLTAYKAGTGKATLKSGVLDGFKDKAGVMYFDMASVMDAIATTSASNPQSGEIMPTARQTFNNVKGYMNNFNGNYTEAHFDLNFINEKENSLTSLVKFATKVAEVNRKYSVPEVTIDSTMAP